MIVALVAGLCVSALVSAALTAVLVPLLRRAQIVDIPVDRSLHEVPVPRGGGIAVSLAVVLSVLVAPSLASSMGELAGSGRRLDVIALGLLTILAFAVLGAFEDLYSMSPIARFQLQLMLGLLMGLGLCLETGAPLWLALGIAVCTAALVNVTNFMDGANGLASGHGVVTALWFVVVSLTALVPGLGFLMVSVAGACLGFLPFNVHRARVFLGDSGSYALGGAWSFAASISLLEGVAFDAALAPLLVLVADTGYTLWMRIRAGQRWYQPHKLHVYQRLVTAGWPHWATALLVSGVAVACAAYTWVDLRSGQVSVLPELLIGLTLLAYVRMPAAIGAPSPFHQSRGMR